MILSCYGLGRTEFGVTGAGRMREVPAGAVCWASVLAVRSERRGARAGLRERDGVGLSACFCA